MFGFSLKELASGEESLRDARLSEALYGSALGGLAGFQTVLGDLTKQHEQLYLPSATKRTINMLISQIRSQQAAIRGVQLRPREYECSRMPLLAASRRVRNCVSNATRVNGNSSEAGVCCKPSLAGCVDARWLWNSMGWHHPPSLPHNALEQYTAIRRSEIGG